MSGISEVECRYITSSLRAERVGGERRIEGLAIAVNTRSVDLGGFYEYIRPEALDRTFRADKRDIHAYYNHDSGKVLGYSESGTLQLRRDKSGLHVTIYPPATPTGEEVMTLLDRGDIRGMSFGFRVLDEDWRTEDGAHTRDVTDMVIHEVSVVSKPAYQATNVKVAQRSLDTFLKTVAQEKGERYYRDRLRLAR